MASLTAALTFLQTARSGSTSRATVIDFTTVVETHSKSVGLSPDHLSQLMHIILGSSLNVTTIGKLIKSLIPQTTVPASCILAIMSKFHSIAQPHKVALLRWIILIFNDIDDINKLHQIYGVFFHFIDFEKLRPYLCNILYLLTRRQDVQPFRIRRLLSLQQRVGTEPSLIALLSCYHLFCPTLISLVIKRTRKRWFPALDNKMKVIIDTVQGRYRAHHGNLSNNLSSKHGLSVSHLAAPGDIPNVRSLLGQQTNKMGLEQINSIDDLIVHFDKLELPSQAAAILQSKHFQHLICCSPNSIIVSRLSHWLSIRLLDEIPNLSGGVSVKFSALLGAIVQFASFMQETMGVLDNFLAYFLRRWNGVDYRSHILTLLTLMVPRPWEELYMDFLKPLIQVFKTATVEIKCDILQCFTKIIHRFATYNWLQTETEDRVFLHSLCGPVTAADYSIVMNELFSLTNQLSAISLLSDPQSFRIQDVVLSHFESTLSLSRRHSLLMLVEPASTLVYSCLLSSTTASVSRICGVLAMYKQEYDRLRTLAEAEKTVAAQDVLLFNKFLMDVVNTCWKQKSFDKSCLANTLLFDLPMYKKATIAGQDKDSRIEKMRQSLNHSLIRSIPSILPQIDLLSSLSFTQSAFAGVALQHLHNLQKSKQIDLVPSSIMADRPTYLEYLKSRHLNGIHEFMFTFITSLKPSVQQTANA